MSPVIKQQLASFRPELRARVLELANRHERLAQVSISFPGLLVALAYPRRSFDPGPVIDAVIAGASLAQVAKAAGVPLWLRRMKPSYFAGTLPLLPDSAFLRRRIVNHFPKKSQTQGWLERVSVAEKWVHEEFGLWSARTYVPETVRCRPFRLLCLWAWYSGQPGILGYELANKRWFSDISLEAALDASADWYSSVRLQLQLGRDDIAETWHRSGRVNGFDFVPLDNASDIIQAATILRNCARSYGKKIATNRSRLWGVQYEGGFVGMVEIQRDQNGFPFICNLDLSSTTFLEKDAWSAAQSWLADQDMPRFNTPPSESVPLDRAAWVALWKPYWLSKKRIPQWLPLSPSANALEGLEGRTRQIRWVFPFKKQKPDY